MSLRKICRPLTAMVLASLVFTSCSRTKSNEIEYFPFKTENSKWGMLSPDGKILFEDEFEQEPTIVRDGRFFARIGDSYGSQYELFVAAEHPKPIGAEYSQVTPFRNGRALVVEKGKCVTIIDTEGKVIKELDKIDGKKVKNVYPFSIDGYAFIETDDRMCGLIDDDGNCVLKPVYARLSNLGDGRFWAVDPKLAEKADEVGGDNVKYPIINTRGEVLYEFLPNKYVCVGRFYDGKIPVAMEVNGEEAWEIINLMGETIVKPSVKIEKIGEIEGDLFTFRKDGKWGLMNFKGETLIRAKYEKLAIDGEDRLWAEFKDGDSYKSKTKLIDTNDNQIGDDVDERKSRFSDLDGMHAFVSIGDKELSIIDRDGKMLGLQLNKIGHLWGYYVSSESEYVE